MRPMTLLALVAVLFVRTACLFMSLRLFLVVVLLFLLQAGCSHDLQRGLDAGQKALALVDVASTHAGQTLKLGTQAAADTCRVLHPGANEAEREACMHKAGLAPADVEEARAALQTVGDAYSKIADALELIEQVYPQLESALEAAKEARR